MLALDEFFSPTFCNHQQFCPTVSSFFLLLLFILPCWPRLWSRLSALYWVGQSRYVVNRWHAALLLVISAILQAGAVAGLILPVLTKAPDILGYVSTLARDNLYFIMPDGGNTLDGVDMAKQLAHVQVGIADSRPDEAVGHVVFCRIDAGDDFPKRRLKLKRSIMFVVIIILRFLYKQSLRCWINQFPYVKRQKTVPPVLSAVRQHLCNLYP